jgi:sensor histidine kinase YesM
MGFAPQSDDGVGLANIRERLAALYNGRAELIIGIPSTGGTSVTIKVPYEIVASNA